MAIVEQTEADGPDQPSFAYANYYGYGGGYTPTVIAAAAAGGVPGAGGINGSSRGVWEAAARGGGAGLGGAGWADAAALVRRAKALGIPPLPPNLGAVR